MNKFVYILLIFFTLNSFAQKEQKVEPNVNISGISIYPNPFNDKTNISFYSASEANISFIVQDLLGNIVKSENIILTKGKNTIKFYKNQLISGIYIYSLKTKDKVISKRFVIK